MNLPFIQEAVEFFVRLYLSEGFTKMEAYKLAMEIVGVMS